MNKIKVVAIYRGQLTENRGTPIRVRNLLSNLTKYVDLTLFSCDKETPLDCRYFSLTNKHCDDLKKIKKFINKNKVDIVIGHTMAAGYYLLPLRFLTRAKIVLEMHGFIEEELLLYGGINKFFYLLSKVLYRIIYKSCHLITTCSDTARDVLLKYNKNTVSIFGGADLEIFNPNVASKQIIKKREGEIVIGYAGNLKIWQGVNFLLEVYKILRKDCPEFRLAILTSERNKLSPMDDVEIFEALENKDVPNFLIDCDILVIPRPNNRVNYLSFPSKLIEYMAMGKAVVASRTSDAHKIISDGYNGLLYDPGDINGAIDCLKKLRDEKIRKYLGNNALLTVKDNYTWQLQTRKFYDNILKNV